MTPESVMDLAYAGMRVAVLLAAPALLVALFLGLTVSLFQAVTQINEMTLSFIPKILGVGLTLLIFGPYMLQLITNYTAELLQGIPSMIR
ncbi:flagellar biosynthetic protein FliQ [Halioglobus japonicus]|uniref:Flagellar biosynthetic protein FliQ n=1 Tax=Halioglobus japonicus TaxID=930805 RepID=A0AAP8MDZ6_9GAMM|nr:flagellar biosynthesis protein FliQ [Halioglobus japonicus]AQA18090.1 flagellar biosynthetic protein FliQ [Halioglobus japonicus]PLW86081.1 flagellar biosynthetic protein FliQ [Halioglobus japonicus]GHD14582.1 flagellar export apparatus protein FliQ [Halioglobus japonicus]